MLFRKKEYNPPEFNIGDKVEIIDTVSTADGCLGEIIRIDRYDDRTPMGKKIGNSYHYEVAIIKGSKAFNDYNIKYLGWDFNDIHSINLQEDNLSPIKNVNMF